jgi:hypothetical protein
MGVNVISGGTQRSASRVKLSEIEVPKNFKDVMEIIIDQRLIDIDAKIDKLAKRLAKLEARYAE